jgi:hypothetical protein
MALPIATPPAAHPGREDGFEQPVHLLVLGATTDVVAPSHFVGQIHQVFRRDAMRDAQNIASQPGKERLGLIFLDAVRSGKLDLLVDRAMNIIRSKPTVRFSIRKSAGGQWS